MEVVFLDEIIERRSVRGFFVNETKVLELKTKIKNLKIWYCIKTIIMRGDATGTVEQGEIRIRDKDKDMGLDLDVGPLGIKIVMHYPDLKMKELELYDGLENEKIEELAIKWVLKEENGEWRINPDLI